MTRTAAKHPAVSWHLPDGNGGFQKTPFMYSTQAESFFMRVLAEEGHTFASALKVCHYAPTAEAICQRFVEEGYGDVMMEDFVR